MSKIVTNKKSRIIPKGWAESTLASIADQTRPISYGIVQTGKQIEKGVKCIRVVDIVDNAVKESKLITTSKEISQSYKRTVLKENDLVIALRGKIGEVATIPASLIGANLTRGVALIAPKAGIDPEFIKQQLTSPHTKKQLVRSLNGSALQELSIAILRNTKILLPVSIKEQRKISRILVSFDSMINKLTRLIKAKEKRKAGLLQNVLTGRIRFKGFKEKWGEVEIGEILSYEQPTKYLDEPEENLHKGIPVLTANKSFLLGFTNNIEGVYSKLPVIIFDDFTTDSKYVEFPFKVKSSAIKFLQPQSKNINLKFVFEKMAMIQTNISDHKRRFISEYQFNIISIPTIGEQNKIADLIHDMDTEIQKLKTQLEKRKLQKKAMMSKLLTGKIRVKI